MWVLSLFPNRCPIQFNMVTRGMNSLIWECGIQCIDMDPTKSRSQVSLMSNLKES